MLSSQRPATPSLPSSSALLSSADDSASLALIAQLLEEEVRRAPRLPGWTQAVPPPPPSPPSTTAAPSAHEPDSLLSLRQQLTYVQSTLSVSSIPSIARADLTARTDRLRAEQAAREYEQATRGEVGDEAFARALQKVDDEGGDVDLAERMEAKTVLGEEKWKALVDPPEPGKGKARALDLTKSEDDLVFFAPPHASSSSSSSYPSVPPALPTDPRTHPCAICMDDCRPVSDPYGTALAPGGSSAGSAPYGLFVGPRADKHLLCLGCAVGYLTRKIDDRSRKVFPVTCVECTYELTDLDASHILGKVNMEAWHFRKLLDTAPPLYCPNKRCSVRVLRHEDQDENRAMCPACKQCICVKCETMYHTGMDCEQFQALPAEQRANPEDISLHQLAATQNWKRCPGCRAMIERTQGCWHMTCDCGKEWCWGCEGDWLRRRGEQSGRCAREPPCELWGHEDDLLDEVERQRRRQQQAQAAAQQQQRQQHQHQHVPPLQPQPHYPQQQQDWYQQPPPPYDPQPQHGGGNGARDWDLRTRIRALDFVRTAPAPRHPFTHIFLENNECGYCQRQFAHSQALQQHLASAPHDVYACTACERLYRARAHLEQHSDANPGTGHEEYVWEP
ncbi:hypothetical protein JCM6882_000936 [Rhodosporidiobolus microsporus]